MARFVALAAVVVFVASCSGSAAKRSAPATTTTTAAIAATAPAITSTTIARDACTEADLDEPVDRGVPASSVITRRLVIEPYATFLDPPGSVTPTISAETAWHTVTKARTGGGRGQLMLGYATAQGPKLDHALVWFVEVHHLASEPMPPGGVPAPLGGVTGLTAPVTTAPPTCVFGGEYEVVDATTGRELWGASGPEDILFEPQLLPYRSSP